MIAVAVIFALAVDMVCILLTGIINPRYLFHTGIHMAGIGRICADCVPCAGSCIWPCSKEIQGVSGYLGNIAPFAGGVYGCYPMRRGIS